MCHNELAVPLGPIHFDRVFLESRPTASGLDHDLKAENLQGLALLRETQLVPGCPLVRRCTQLLDELGFGGVSLAGTLLGGL